MKLTEVSKKKLFELSMQVHKSNIIRLCEREPKILARLASIMCNYNFAEEYSLDRLIYQAHSYEDICMIYDDEIDTLPNILDEYKQDSKYLFKWHFESSKLIVDPEPITYADVMAQTIKDKDNILKCFFERAFNYPGSEVYCQDLLSIKHTNNDAFWYNCDCINQTMIDYLYH